MRRRTVVLLAIIVILISTGALVYVQRTGLSVPLAGFGLSGTDFLGTWYTHNPTTPIIGGLIISENQGTYTVTVVSVYGATLGMSVLTVNPPNAHVFLICPPNLGIISADLTLQLLNSTLMQVKESIALSTTSLLATAQFVKSNAAQVSQITTPTLQTSQQLILEGYSFPSGGHAAKPATHA